MIMTPTRFVTRRATVDDLPQLISLWHLEQLPAEALEKRFTEFQIVSDDAGQVMAAIGFQIAGTQALLHSESMARPELSDTMRDLLWKRLHVIIQNHALERLWTQMDSVYWRDRGFTNASDEQRKGLPVAYLPGEHPWLVMTLRAADANAAVEKELAQFKTLQQEETARMRQRVQTMKRLALGITVIVFLLVVAWAVVLLRYGPKMFGRH